MCRHHRYINILEEIAVNLKPVARARIAACVVYKNQLVSVGINKMKSHPIQARFGKNKDAIFLHAENCAIINALKELDEYQIMKCTMYIVRMKHDDDLNMVRGLAKPCDGCHAAIEAYGIHKVYYTLDNGSYVLL